MLVLAQVTDMAQSKLIPFFWGIDPTGTYTIGEIIDRARVSGLLEELYSLDAAGSKRARSAIVAYLSREKIEPVGSKMIGKKKCQAFLGKDLLTLGGQAEVEPAIPDQPVPARPIYWPYLLLSAVAAVAAGLIVALLLYPKADPLDGRIQQLEEAGDDTGLRALNQETSELKETVSQEDKDKMLASSPLKGLTFETSVYNVYPNKERLAEAIAGLDDDVVVIESIVTVLPGLALWEVVDENGDYRAVALGTKIVVKDIHGTVTNVTQKTLYYLTETGEQRQLTRESLTVLGYTEQPGDKSIFYAREEGNLAGLSELFAKILGIPEPEAVTGQIVGFFPVFTNPQQVYDLLTQTREETVALVVGFHHTIVTGNMPANEILNRFKVIAPFRLEWEANLTEEINYVGGSFRDTLNYIKVTPTKITNGYTLLRD